MFKRIQLMMGMVLLSMGAQALNAQQSYTLSGNPAVYAPAGEVEVIAGSGSEVTVSVQRMGPDAGQLEVASGVVRGRSSLRVIYPGNDIVYDRGDGSRYQTQLRIREDGTFGENDGRRVRVRSAGDGVRAHVRLQIAVPAGGSLLVRVGAGEIVATNTRGDIELDMSSGPITATGIVGRVNADTGSGQIRISEVEGDVNADSGSGSIVVSDSRSGSLQQN